MYTDGYENDITIGGDITVEGGLSDDMHDDDAIIQEMNTLHDRHENVNTPQNK